MKKYSSVVVPLMFLLLLVSCSKIDGFFAFKKFQDTSYKKYSIHKEFSRNESVKWMFVASKVSSPTKIGVLLLKRELVWVPVSSRKEIIHLTKRRIYGEIKDLEAGNYKILITNIKKGNSIVGQCLFKVFEE